MRRLLLATLLVLLVDIALYLLIGLSLSFSKWDINQMNPSEWDKVQRELLMTLWIFATIVVFGLSFIKDQNDGRYLINFPSRRK